MELIKGYKKTDLGILPEDWEIRKFKEITNAITCGVAATPIYVQEFEGMPFLSASHVQSGKVINANYKFISKELYSQITKNNKPEKGDVLYTRVGAGIGQAGVIDFDLDFAIYVSLTLIKVKSSINSNYIKFLLNSNYYQFLAKNTQFAGGGVQNLNVNIVREFLIPIPSSIAEQNAIATALSDADALINNLEKLIEKKKNIKQGTMQQLLKPKNGWVIKKVQDIAQIGRGRVISHKEIASSIENTFPVYSSQTTNNGIMGYIGSYDFDGEYITWTTDGENAGTVFYRDGKFNCTNVCGTIKLKSENARFISYLLNSVTPLYVSKNLANPKLMNDVMKKIEIAIPDIKEQFRISNIILDLELELKALENKLNKWLEIKQGMMQNLLTGKIRLVCQK